VEVVMPVDLQMLQNIHRIIGDLGSAERDVKTLLEDYDDYLAELPEHQAVAEAERALKEARDRLKIAIQRDPELARLADKIDEAKFQRRDLGEILSHHLLAYHEETGRDVVRDEESRNRKIELKAKLGKPALDQPRLPLGINRHLGEHVPIPTREQFARGGEAAPEEGE
jgi:hypothetical protein